MSPPFLLSTAQYTGVNRRGVIDIYYTDKPTPRPVPQEPPFRSLQFLAKFLRSPRTVGSVTPSSRFLARKMMQPIQWDRVSAIAELGAGTGVLTREIHARMNRDTPIIVYEHDADMRACLQAAFPAFHHRPDAMELTRTIRELGLPGLDCIISGLPLAVFAPKMRNDLIDQVVSALNPGGLFVQFQYSPQMLPQLRRRFSAVRVGFVPLNFPPALVYVCTK